MLVNIVNTLFYLFSFIMLISAVAVIWVKNPVHSVLFLILTFFNAAALFLLSGSEFLAMLLLIVYVGAVMVLFLFVVMMLNINFTEIKAGFSKHLLLGLLVAALMLAELLLSFFTYDFGSAKLKIAKNLSNTAELGNIIYTDYVFYFELAGVILLVAMICSIVLTLHHRENVKRQSISEQVSRNRENAIEIKQVKSHEGIQ